MSYDKEEANTWFKIGYEDETRKREKTNAVFNTIRENVREEKKEETDIEMAKREASEGRGYYSLVMAANIVAGLPKSMALHHGLPSYLIWTKAASARRHRWRVSGELTRPKDDFAIPVRQVQRAEESFVYLSDFVEWAIEVGCTVAPSAVEEARRECEVSDSFDRRVRLWQIERTRAELVGARTEKPEVILAREARLAALERERVEIVSLLNGEEPAGENSQANAAGQGPDERNSARSSSSGATGPQTALERRTERLRLWLRAQQVPESNWNPFPGWTLKDIYLELRKFDEFLTPDGLHIEFSTFSREFWRRQKICKLPNRAK